MLGKHLKKTYLVIITLLEKNTQAIERKHLTLRNRIKRLTRKTIYLSKSGWILGTSATRGRKHF